MGYGSRAVLAFGALVLALCVLATASGDPLTWDPPERDRTGSDTRDGAGTDESGSSEEVVEEERTGEDDGLVDAPGWLPAGRLAALALMAALIAVLVGLIARLRVSFRRRRLSGDQLRATLTPVVPPDLEDDDEPLAEAVDGALDDLTHGNPRNSIVAAWLRLEHAAETRWFVRNPADTPSEFAERVLTSYDLDAEVVGQLAALYREARFSDHPITDRQRDEARACLTTLLAGLRTHSGTHPSGGHG